MRKLKKILQSNIFYIILLILSLLYAIINPFKNSYKSVTLADNTFTGKVKEIAINGDKLDLTVKLKSKEEIKATYYIKTKEELDNISKNIRLGITIILEGTLSKPSNNTIPNTFNYRKYLENKNIFYLLKVDKYNIIKEENFIYKIRNLLENKIDKSKTGTYLKAFVLGDNKAIDKEITKSYRINGVTHLFAISGMHIGLITMLISNILNKFKIKNVKKLIIMIIFIIFYGFITGFAASFLRASLFFILVNIFKTLKIDIEIKYIFYLTISALLLFKPLLLYDIGFEYSVVTSLGIILSSKYLDTNNKVISLFKVSLIAFLFSAPITLYYYYEINLLSVINNLLFVPLISSILFPLCLITYLINITNPILSIVINITEKISLFLSKYFVLSINIPLNIFTLILIYIILLLAINKNKKYLLLIIVLVFSIKLIPYFDSNCYVYYFDVGQGDSALIITSHRRRVILVDTGGKIEYQKEDWAKRETTKVSDNIITFLKSIGITKIDNLILTHGDYDHMGDAINIVNNIDVKSIIFNNDSFNKLENNLIEVLNKKEIKYYQNINELDLGNNKMYFLNTSKYDNENDNSNVLYLKLQNYNFLFMGDAGIEKEKDILNKYNLENIDFLKVGHHGSDTSSSKDFINSINPKYSLISVGKNNRYGHPKDSVLNNLQKSKVYRTDIDGSIEVKLNNNGYKIKTYQP